jgi:hypothetical protein
MVVNCPAVVTSISVLTDLEIGGFFTVTEPQDEGSKGVCAAQSKDVLVFFECSPVGLENSPVSRLGCQVWPQLPTLPERPSVEYV